MTTLSDAHFRLLVESVKDYAIFLLDENGIVRSWNRGAQQIKGWTAEEILGKPISTFYTAEDNASGRWKLQLERALEHGRWEDVGWRVRKDGTTFWASVVYTALYEGDRHIGFAKITRDLTDRAYRAFVEATNAIVWTTDGDGHPNADSPSWRAFTGQTEDEWRGLQGWTPVHPDDVDALRVTWPEAKRNKSIFEAQFRLRRHDGEYVWMAARAIPFLNPNGTVREWFGVTFDISARRRAEEEREEALLRFTTTLASIGDGVIATDENGKISFINPVAERLTGWLAADAVGRSLGDVFTIRSSPEQKVLARRDGSTVAIDDSTAPIIGQDGRLDGVVLVFRDVSALAQRAFLAKVGEDLLACADYREALRRLAAVAVPHFADGCAVDLVEVTTGVRQRIVTTGSLKAPDASNVIRTGRSEVSPTEMIVALRGRTRVLGAITFIHGESMRRYTADDRDLAEEVARRAVLAIERRRLEEETATANRMKDEFLATVSHELRTPLQAILGWASILKRGGRDPQKGLETIERNAIAQARLIDDMLDVSRIISGKLRLAIGRCDVAKTVRAAMDAVRPAAVARQVFLTEDFDPTVGEIEADVDRMQQIVWNLVANAVKFTEAGGVVHVQLERAGDDVRISVRDSGRGIAAEQLDRVFERFRQLDSTPTRKQGGLGLGLAIVRYLVEAHGGSVRAESEGVGHGATFVVTLPAKSKVQIVPPRDAPSHPSLPESSTTTATLDGVRVLLVEDDNDTRDLISTILVEAGAVVDTARTAAEAFAKIVRSVPDVISSDVGMPIEDGYALMARVRKLPASQGGNVPALAMTAFARPDDVRRANEAGFQKHLAKPIDPDVLVATLRDLVPKD